MKYNNGTAQPNLSAESLASFLFPLPPIWEQGRIIQRMVTIQPHIADYDVAEQKLSALNAAFPDALKKSILQAAVQGKLVEQDPADEPASVLLKRIRAEKEALIKAGKIKRDKNGDSVIFRRDNSHYEIRDGAEVRIDEELPFEIPESWEWVRIRDFAQLINGDRGKNYPSKDKLSTDLSSGLPFISAVNLEDGRIDTSKLLFLSQNQFDLLGSGKFNQGDFIFCLRGSLGKNAIAQLKRGAIASSLVILRHYLEYPLAEYFKMYLDSPLLTSEIMKYNNGTAQPNLSAESLASFLFPLPPLAEQQRIVEHLGALLPLLEMSKAASSA
jgi:type I restriction enzyme S subunit